MKNKKAQSAAEFIVLITAVMFIFLSFAAIIQQNIAQKNVEKRNLQVQELALTAQNELNIAAKATDGFYREFSLPAKIVGLDYNLTLVNNNTVYVVTEDLKHSISLPGQNAIGEFVKGPNIIQKQNKTIYLNVNP